MPHRGSSVRPVAVSDHVRRQPLERRAVEGALRSPAESLAAVRVRQAAGGLAAAVLKPLQFGRAFVKLVITDGAELQVSVSTAGSSKSSADEATPVDDVQWIVCLHPCCAAGRPCLGRVLCRGV